MDVSLNRIAELLKSAQNIVVTAHVNPDGDSLGSMLALFSVLQSQGKEVRLLLDDKLPGMYDFLPHIKEIVRPLEGEKINADLLVVLDASDIERIGRVKSVTKAPVMNIDHHISNRRFADYLYLDSKASATGEILAELLAVMKHPLNDEIATCLYTAIATDCGFFQYANTSARTLRHAACMVEAGAKPQAISEALERRPLSTFMMLSKALTSIESYHNGQISVMTITRDMVGDDDENTEGFINYARSVTGTEVAILFREVSEKVVRISFRSHRADVSKIASEFGGGGHIRAAGCTVHDVLESAKDMVIRTTTRQLS